MQPDIIFFSNARSSALTKAGASGAPDLAIEIVSPDAEKRDCEQKRKIFARSRRGRKLWLILPDRRRMEIYRLQENPERRASVITAAGLFESRLFPGLTIKAAEVFAD